MTGNSVGFDVEVTDRDQVTRRFRGCCGCDCTTVRTPPPPLQCDAPFDFDAQILANNVGILTQTAFQSIPLNATNVLSNATYVLAPSGYTVKVIRGNYAFNNNFQNTNPSTPNNLLYENPKDDLLVFVALIVFPGLMVSDPRLATMLVSPFPCCKQESGSFAFGSLIKP